MNQNQIKEMVHSLRSILKDKDKVQRLLEKYWRDKKAIIWDIKQVHRAANERELVLTNVEARQILQKLISGHNPQYGINWHMLLEAIEESCFGRKLSKQELKAFLEKDVITIQK